jgi:hypothetical protein
MSKPGDFYVGVLDFFGALLPGAFVVGTARVLNIPYGVPGFVTARLTLDASKIGAFLGLSYVVGQVCNALGSLVLDYFYDLLYAPGAGWLTCKKSPFERLEQRRSTIRKFIEKSEKLAQDKRSEMISGATDYAALKAELDASGEAGDRDARRGAGKARLLLTLAAIAPGGLFEFGTEARRDDLKQQIEACANGRGVRGVYQGVRAYLRLTHADAFAELEKIEGEQKFFRALAIGAVLLDVALAVTRSADDTPNRILFELLPHLPWLFVALAVFSFIQYVRLRRKAVERAYVYFALRDSARAATPVPGDPAGK